MYMYIYILTWIVLTNVYVCEYVLTIDIFILSKRKEKLLERINALIHMLT